MEGDVICSSNILLTHNINERAQRIHFLSGSSSKWWYINGTNKIVETPNIPNICALITEEPPVVNREEYRELRKNTIKIASHKIKWASSFILPFLLFKVGMFVGVCEVKAGAHPRR